MCGPGAGPSRTDRGALIAGAGTDLAGLGPTLVALAAVYALVTLDPFLRLSWQAMDQRSPSSAAGDAVATDS